MLIRSAKAAFQPSGSLEASLRGSGIKECRREFLLFIDRAQYEKEQIGAFSPLESKIGLAFQINLSIADGRGSFSFLGRGSNSSYIRMNVYAYDVHFEGGFKNPDLAYFTLRSAFGSEIYRDYNEHYEKSSDVSLFNKLYGSASLDLYNQFFSGAPIIVLPEYYTEDHMAFELNDFYSVIDYGESVLYTGSQLIDPHTKIKYMDVSAWGSVEHTLRSIFDKVRENETVENSIGGLFTAVAPTMITGTTFQYDTELGSGMKGGSIPFQSYRDPKQVINDLSFVNNMIKIECEALEKTYGSIRVFYTPFLHGDTMRIHVKDQPNLILDKTIGVDRDFSTLHEMNRLVEAIHDD